MANTNNIPIIAAGGCSFPVSLDILLYALTGTCCYQGTATCISLGALVIEESPEVRQTAAAVLVALELKDARAYVHLAWLANSGG